MSVDNLPDEILLKILGLLPYDDLESAFGVSRRWMRLAGYPLLWRNFRLEIKFDEELEENYNLDELFTKRPFYQRIGSLDVEVVNEETCRTLAPKLFSTVVALGVEMKKLCIWGDDWSCITGVPDLTDVDTEHLVAVAKKVESLELSETTMSDFQLNSLFSALEQEHGNLKYLDLTNNNLSSVNSDHLANVVKHISTVVLEDTSLSKEQLEKLFLKLATSDINLKSLSLIIIDMLLIDLTCLE
eukprot:GFUD01041413.1.p1 GENE.GFUD01041413.1~~GFUD01041413.1.p1  ORF type:complete len:243 (+),score=42.34 GFUD01041413.1:68-796(+)